VDELGRGLSDKSGSIMISVMEAKVDVANGFA
jgi:hypothetical protein